MPRPTVTPIGLELARAAKLVGRAFDEALAAAGGSQPRWLILLALVKDPTASQRRIAATVGIEGATLTHHLNAMEDEGLIARRRDPADRRVHIVALTDAGQATFRRLRGVALAFDGRLRDGLGEAELDRLRDGLTRLADNAARGEPGAADGSGGRERDPGRAGGRA